MKRILGFGGWSLPGTVEIHSDEFSSMAVFNDSTKEIKVNIKSKDNKNKYSKDKYDNFRYNGWFSYSPLIFYFIFGIVNIVCSYFAMSKINFVAILNTCSKFSDCETFLTLFWPLLIIADIIVLILTFHNEGTSCAGFHGAEHKAINAFRKWREKYNITKANEFTVISKLCGTNIEALYILFAFYNFVLIFSIAFAKGFILTAVMWLISWIFVWILLHLKNTTSIYRFCFYIGGKYVQKYFTVREPLPHELLTAHCAMLGLLSAYGKKVEMPEGVVVEK